MNVWVKIFCLLMLASCNEELVEVKKINKSLASKTLSHQAKSHKGLYIVEWQSYPKNIPLNQYFDIEFVIREPLKAVNYRVDLAVNAGMKAHNHGMHSKPIVERLGKQHFKAKGMLFHMPGQWQIELEIDRGVMKDSVEIEILL